MWPKQTVEAQHFSLRILDLSRGHGDGARGRNLYRWVDQKLGDRKSERPRPFRLDSERLLSEGKDRDMKDVFVARRGIKDLRDWRTPLAVAESGARILISSAWSPPSLSHCLIVSMPPRVHRSIRKRESTTHGEKKSLCHMPLRQ